MFDARTLFEGETCPICGKKTLGQKAFLYKEPRSMDELIFFVTLCAECNFKKTEVMPLAPSSHVTTNHHVISIKTQDDLETKIYRASTGSIEIPELEIKLEPGIQADFFITNIERILLKFKDSCQFMLQDAEEEPTRLILEKRIKEIDECISGKREFTVVLDDPEGFSYVLPVTDQIL
jgi:zinc finger protein